MRAPLPKVPALLDVWAASGDHVLALIDREFKLSHDQGRTWVAANMPDWLLADPWGAVDNLGLDNGLVVFTDEDATSVTVYSLAENKVTKNYQIADSSDLAALTSTQAIVRNRREYRLVTLDGSSPDRVLPADYSWNRVLGDGYVLGYTWDDDEEVFVLADPSGNVSEITRGDEAWATGSGNTIVYWPVANSTKICARTVTDSAVSCQTLIDATPENDRWVDVRVLSGGVLAQVWVEESFDHPLFWVPLSGGALQAPKPLTLGNDVLNFDLVWRTDVPLVSTVTATEGYLERINDSGGTTRIATGVREVTGQASALTPTDVLLQGYSPYPLSTTWHRSVGSSLGAASALATVDDNRSSALASAGRWLVPTASTAVKLYDRGQATETISGLYADGHYSGYNAAGAVSGPNLLLQREGWQFRNAGGAWLSVPQAVGIFGGLVLEDLTDYDADDRAGRLRIRDLSGDGNAAIEFSPANFDGGEVFWWGDTVAYQHDSACYDEDRDEEQDGVVVYNFRTSATVYSACGDLIGLGDGFVVLQDGTGTAAVSFDNGRTPLDASSRGVVIDGARVAYTTDSELVIQTIPGVAKSAPRSLGVKAPASYDGTGAWTPEIDLTKPVNAGSLVIKNAAGTAMRTLPVPASADGSIRGVSWDGKDSTGAVVPNGTYSIALTSTGADGSGAVVRTDGTAGALATVAVDVPTPLLPLTSAVPTVSPGTPKVGQELTANPGSWGPAPVSFAYEWFSGTTKVGGNSASYTPGTTDVGKQITVTVTGSKAGYETASKTSLPTTAVVAAAPPVTPSLAVTGAPVVTGDRVLGRPLTVSAGSWNATPDSVAYQWLRNGAVVGSAQTYTLGLDDWAGSISVRVTASKAGYTSASTEVSAVGANALTGVKFTKSVVPTVSGKAKVGSRLTAKVKAWKPKSSKFGYQWLKNGQPIPGATASTYVIRPEDAGASFKVRVAGLLSGYQPMTKDSKATKKVPVPLVAAGKVSVSGKAKVGTTLTAKAGTWKPAPVALAYQWLRNGKAIAGATGSTYTLTTADVKANVSVRVTGSKAWFKSVVKTSKKTGKVKV